MTQVQEDLEAAYDVLEAHGWCQGNGQDGDGKVCLEGAVAAVTLGSPQYWATRRYHHQAFVLRPSAWVDMPRELIERHADAVDALEAALTTTTGRERDSVYMWNDTPGRTVEDVKELMRTAIKAEIDKGE